MKTIGIIYQGIKGRQPRELTNQGSITACIGLNNSLGDFIIVDAFEGSGPTYKRRKDPLIRIDRYPSDKFFEGTFDQLIDQLSEGKEWLHLIEYAMKKDEYITEVQFRKMKDYDVIAVFPYEIESMNCTSSYMHVGQHGSCAWNVNSFTKPAKKSEYQDLYNELVSLGYNLKMIKRRSHTKYLKAYYESLKPKE